jgi:hypothetical protein
LGPTSIKAARKTFVKLIPGVNFIKVLHAAFALVGSKSAKRHCQIH